MDLTSTVCATSAAVAACKPLREQLLALSSASCAGRPVTVHLAALSAAVAAVEKATDSARAAAGAASAAYAAKMADLHGQEAANCAGNKRMNLQSKHLQDMQNQSQHQLQSQQHNDYMHAQERHQHHQQGHQVQQQQLQVNQSVGQEEHQLQHQTPVQEHDGREEPEKPSLQVNYARVEVSNEFLAKATNGFAPAGASPRAVLEAGETACDSGANFLLQPITRKDSGLAENDGSEKAPEIPTTKQTSAMTTIEPTPILEARAKINGDVTGLDNTFVAGMEAQEAEPREPCGNHHTGLKTPTAPRKPRQGGKGKYDSSRRGECYPEFENRPALPETPSTDGEKGDMETTAGQGIQNIENLHTSTRDGDISDHRENDSDWNRTWTRSRSLRNKRKSYFEEKDAAEAQDQRDSEDGEDGEELHEIDRNYSDDDGDGNDDESVEEQDEDMNVMRRQAKATVRAENIMSVVPSDLSLTQVAPGMVLRASILKEFMSKLANERYGEMLDAVLALQTSTYWSLRCDRHGTPPQSSKKTKTKSKKCNCEWRLCMRVVNEQEVIAAKSKANKEDEREAQIEAAIVHVNSFQPNHTGHSAEPYRRGPGIDPNPNRRQHPIPQPVKRRRNI